MISYEWPLLKPLLQREKCYHIGDSSGTHKTENGCSNGSMSNQAEFQGWNRSCRTYQGNDGSGGCESGLQLLKLLEERKEISAEIEGVATRD